MRRIASLLLLLAVAIGARADFAAPDFAYPQTVVGDAEAVLASTTDPALGLTRMRAVMEIVKAKSAIASDSLYMMPAFIARQTSREQNADVRGLMKLYQASVLNSIYNRASWRYNRVDAPALPLPANPDEWSGEQFRTRIKELTDSAITILRPYMSASITDYKEVIAIGEQPPTFYPYLRDFIYNTAAEMVADSRAAYVETALNMTTRGTPEWALWTAKWEKPATLLDTYKANPGGVAGGYLLWKASECDDEHETEVVGLIRKYLADNGVNLMTDALKSRLEVMTVPKLALKVPSMAMPGTEFEVECEYSYTDQVGVKIYRATNPASGKYPPAKTLVGTFVRKVDKNIAKGKIKIPVKIDKTGNYLAYGTCSGMKEADGGYTSLIVAPWVPVVLSDNDENVVVVAKGSDGSPVANVKAALCPPRAKSQVSVGATATDGCLTFRTPKSISKQNGFNPLRLTSQAGSVYYGYQAGIGSYITPVREDWLAADIMVGRPVYHPGDTVQWSAVVVSKSFNPVSSSLAKDTELKAILRDANGTPLDTLDVTTDRFGRVYGSFPVPADLLSGRFNIRLTNGRLTVAQTSVMVSDFKAPVFEVKDVAVNHTDTAYVLTGRAVRYSGVGLPDAEVTADVTYRWEFYRYYNSGNTDNLPQIKGRTDADGSFSIVIPMQPGMEGCYQCNVTVTSMAADIASASTSFRVGKPYLITGSINAGQFNTDSPVSLPVLAMNTDMKPAAVEARWELCDSDSTSKSVATGPCTIDTLGLKVDWHHVPAGVYELRILPVDTTMFKTAAIGKVTLYSIRRNDVPAQVDLLVPTPEMVVASDTAGVMVGVGSERQVYAVVFGADGKPVVTTRKLSRGFHKLDFNVPATGVSRVKLFTINNCKVAMEDVTIRRSEPSKKLTLHGESWRDRVVPGTREEWKLRLTDADGQGMSGAMVATMYNRALNSLASLPWPSNLASLLSLPSQNATFNISYPVYGLDNIWKSAARTYRTVSPKLVAPAFEFGLGYGGLAISDGGIRIRGTSKLAMNSVATADNGVVMEEAVMDYKAAAPMAAATGGTVETEAEDADESAAIEQDAARDEFSFRESEALQALWMPDLTVDTAGVATLSFTVPDAIGSWAFRAAAWTEDCRAAEMLANLVASKPVMVQPSLPRFLRQGDKARVLATVINNTDSAQLITTRIEIFDPSTGAVIAGYDDRSTLAANAQDTVGIDITAPVDLPMIGYRVKSSTAEFADGEQALIPILEASTLAIDSELFYLNEAEPTFTTTIPADSKGNGIVAVQYCQNPVWEAVKTLPGLYEREPKTACAAASSAYAALTAKGLLVRFPEIRDVLDIWKSNPADSSLVSKLEKNEDLKMAILAQTPFVGAANANSEQMQRLAMTFNEKDIERVLKASLATLTRLQNPDGGFAWGTWSDESSAWITTSVLMAFGQLNEAGHLPEDSRIDKIVSPALAYLDKNVEGTDYSYTRLYSLFPERKPSTVKGRKAVDETVQEIVGGWKKSSTAAKAQQALILNALGNKAVAAEIMQSVSQFATVNGKRGVSFPSVSSVDAYSSLLYAFAKIDPQSKLIDGMRQWLVLQTQATADLGAWNPTTLVSAILSTGSHWTELPSDATANVTVDGTPLTIDKVEAATGAFSERLAPSAKKRTIKFTRPEGGQVAYGSVVTASTRPLSSVKARGNDQLSITKRLLVERNGKWVETDKFSLGERVRVQLMVKASCNFEFVTVNDDRPAAFEPVDQMPGWVNVSVVRAYRENSDTHTRLFINWLPKGTYYLTYDMTAAYSGTFASGTATVQSQYAPELTARSGAETVTVEK